MLAKAQAASWRPQWQGAVKPLLSRQADSPLVRFDFSAPRSKNSPCAARRTGMQILRGLTEQPFSLIFPEAVVEFPQADSKLLCGGRAVAIMLFKGGENR